MLQLLLFWLAFYLRGAAVCRGKSGSPYKMMEKYCFIVIKMLLAYDTGIQFFTDILVKISSCRIVSSGETNCQKWIEIKLIYHELVFLLNVLLYSCCFTVAERYEREKQDLEKHILELKAKLSHNAVMSEVEELKRCIERKDKEKAQLVMHIQVSWVLLLF